MNEKKGDFGGFQSPEVRKKIIRFIFGVHCVAKNIQENVQENRVVCRPEELFCRPTGCWIWWSEFVFIVVLSELIDNLY